jgi:integrase
MKFTDASIKALKPKSERYEVWETNGKGFGLRVSPTGRKSWLFMYRFETISRRMTLGTYSGMTLSEAHTAHAKAKERLEKGIDPGALHVQSKVDHRGAPTVQKLVDEYIEKRSKTKKAWEEEKRILEKDVLPKWRNRKAKDIKRRDVILLLDKIVERGSPIMANRTLGVLQRMFKFGIGRDILEANPCSVIERPGEESQRDHVLSAVEIKKFWFGLEKCEMAEGTKLALRFLLISLQRKSEVAQAEWKEFDLNSGWWTIPKTKTKNGLPHRVCLSPTSISLLKRVKILSGDSIYLFPSPRGKGMKPITSRSLSQALLRNQVNIGIEHFVPHDLRRTASSHMTGSGIPRSVVQKILNHVEPGVTAVYDRYSYDKEKKVAVHKWDRRLQKILSGKAGKIIEMKIK